MKKICILFCGGTMTMRRNKKGVLIPFHKAQDLLGFVPQLTKLAEFSIHHVVNIDSTNMEPSIWSKLSKEIIKLENEYDGFIITHGTDTMAYTASALSFTLRNIKKPIVFTGAQKSLEDVPSDAVNNLINAAIVALKLKTGIFIVFGSKILQGNRTTKVSESSLDAFDSPMVAPTGTIQLEPEIDNLPVINKQQNISLNLDFDPNIITIKIIPGLSNNNLEKIISNHYHGIILEGYGPGNIPDSLMPFLYKAKNQQLPVIILSQCKNGITKMHLYAVGHQAIVGGGNSGRRYDN